MSANSSDKVPEVSYVEDQLLFVRNEVLRTNLAIAFQYIIFLLGLGKEIPISGPVQYSIYKNVIIYTASIVESLLHHVLNEQIKEGHVIEERVMPKEDKYRDKKILYKIEETNENVIGAILTKKPIRLKPNTQFIQIIRSCKKAKIIDADLTDEIEILRKLRNKVHLAGLESADTYYDKKTVNGAFKTAGKVIYRVEELLTDEDARSS